MEAPSTGGRTIQSYALLAPHTDGHVLVGLGGSMSRLVRFRPSDITRREDASSDRIIERSTILTWHHGLLLDDAASCALPDGRCVVAARVVRNGEQSRLACVLVDSDGTGHAMEATGPTDGVPTDGVSTDGMPPAETVVAVAPTTDGAVVAWASMGNSFVGRVAIGHAGPVLHSYGPLPGPGGSPNEWFVAGGLVDGDVLMCRGRRLEVIAGGLSSSGAPVSSPIAWQVKPDAIVGGLVTLTRRRVAIAIVEPMVEQFGLASRTCIAVCEHRNGTWAVGSTDQGPAVVGSIHRLSADPWGFVTRNGDLAVLCIGLNLVICRPVDQRMTMTRSVKRFASPFIGSPARTPVGWFGVLDDGTYVMGEL